MKEKFFIVYGLIVVAVVITLNPTLLTNQTLAASNPLEKIPAAVQFSENTTTLVASARMYRGGPQRNAWLEDSFALPLKNSTRLQKVNVGIHSASKSSPVVDETGIYVGSDQGLIWAFEPDGKVRWSFQVNKSTHGVHGTPLVNATSVIFGAYNGRLYSLEKKTGHVQWVIQLGYYIGASPVQDKKGDIYISVEFDSPYNGQLFKVSRDGKWLWSSEKSGAHSHSSPVLSSDESLVIFGSNNGVLMAVDTQTGQRRWNYVSAGAIKSTALIAGHQVYFSNNKGYLTALNLHDGKPLWTNRVVEHSLHASPVLVESKKRLFALSMRGQFVAVDSDTGKIVWQQTVGERDLKMSPSAFKLKSSSGRDEWAVVTACQKSSLCFFSTEGRRLQTLEMLAPLTGEVHSFGQAMYLSLDYPGELMRIW